MSKSRRGYIEKRADGSLRLRFQHRRETRSHVFERKISKAKMEAERSRLVEKWKAEIDEELDAPAVPTLETYSTRWLARVEHEIEPATWKRYKEDLDRHVVPAFGSHRLNEVTPKMVREFLRDKAQTTIVKKSGETSYSPNTIRLIKASFSVVMSGALEDEYIDRNPVKGVRLPGSRRKQPGFVSIQEQADDINPMDPEQRLRFLEACKKSRLGVLLTTRLMTGLRPSERYPLRLDSIDWRDGNERIAVEKSVELGTRRVKTTKTRKVRTVDIPTDLVPTLKEHVANLRKKAMKKGWGEPELLFPSETNTILDHSNVATELRRVLKKAGLPRFTTYDLRHTYASHALANGAPLTYVAEQMGISPETVLRYYARWIPSKGKHFADIANGIAVNEATETAHLHPPRKS